MKRKELLWRNAWFVLRRAPRNSRLRLILLRIFLGILYLSAWALYEGSMLRELGLWGGLATGFILSLAVGCAWWMRRHYVKDDALLLRLSDEHVPTDHSLKPHRERLVKELLRAAILCDRAGIEVLCRENKVLEEHRGVCRRRTLDLARSAGLWDSYDRVEQELLLDEEGSWTWESILLQFRKVEAVRVLRWVLLVDEVLTPFEFLRPDLTPVLQTTTQVTALYGDGCRAPWDLRTARDQAHTMMVRCIAEGVHRGAYPGMDEDARHELMDVFGKVTESDDDLYLAQGRVRDVSQSDVEWAAQAAVWRFRALAGVIRYLGGSAEEELCLDELPEETGEGD